MRKDNDITKCVLNTIMFLVVLSFSSTLQPADTGKTLCACVAAPSTPRYTLTLPPIRAPRRYREDALRMRRCTQHTSLHPDDPMAAPLNSPGPRPPQLEERIAALVGRGEEGGEKAGQEETLHCSHPRGDAAPAFL